MKDYKEILEAVKVPVSQSSKDIEAFLYRLKVGDVIDNMDDPNLSRLSANAIKKLYPAGRGMKWQFAKTRPNGQFHDWVFVSKDGLEAIVLKVDVRKDSIISVKKRKAVM